MKKLTFSNIRDNTPTVYQGGFHQEYFFDQPFNDPEYEILTEGYEKEKGFYLATRVEWRKYLTVKIVVNEPLYLALLGGTMVDQITLQDEFGIYKVLSYDIDVTWKGYGYGLAELKFLMEAIIQKRLGVNNN